ncbi:MAG TPA: sulfotransferase family protein [Elainellaceae cyanobacterium]
MTKTRVFILGCPRSGTTLLQSLLTAHPSVASFPESHFFRALLKRRSVVRQTLGLASRSARPRFEEFLHELGHEELNGILPDHAAFVWQYSRAFIRLLDLLAAEEHKDVWIEKTPGHLHYAEAIASHVPNAQFIHILRNGADVVASLYEVTHRHPDIWGGQRSIDDCIERWCQDAQISLQYHHHPRHHLVNYEDLVAHPELVLTTLCDFIGVPFNPIMLQNYKTAAQRVVLKDEQWKASVSQSIETNRIRKFHQVFDEQQQHYILQQLSAVNLSPLSPNSLNYERV